VQLKPIGVIHSPYQNQAEAPRQGRLQMDTGEIEVFPEFEAGLKDIEKNSHLLILYWCDRGTRDTILTAKPWDERVRGVFATRSPNRPNPIAIDLVDLIRRDGNRLVVRGIDALDKSPLLDIKPYSFKLDTVTPDDDDDAG
jgi:tRNA-Thr(GGU) m(6)t(6)A37 methyltransferase TsaA